jgi:GT2 family glycosyltransferase
MADPPLVFLSIVTWNGKDLVTECLRSAMAFTYPNYRIVVVDNASTDGTVEFLRREFPCDHHGRTVTVIANERNLHFTAGANVGIRHALAHGADYVVSMNNDVVLSPNLLDVLVSRADGLPEVGVFSPKMCYADDPERAWCVGSRFHPLTLTLLDFGPGRTERVPADEPRPIQYACGTVMFIRASVLRQVGLFDEERFFFDYEDLDFSLRVRQAGFGLYYVPEAVIWHHVAATEQIGSPSRYYHNSRSSVAFLRKHIKGLRWLAVIPYRLGSAGRTLAKLMRSRRPDCARAYLRGLWDGILGRGGHWSCVRGTLFQDRRDT